MMQTTPTSPADPLPALAAVLLWCFYPSREQEPLTRDQDAAAFQSHAIKENLPGELTAGPKMTGRRLGTSRLSRIDVFLHHHRAFMACRRRGVSGAGERGFAGSRRRVVPSLLISVPDSETVGTRDGGQAAAGNHMAGPQGSLCGEEGEKWSWRDGEPLALVVVFGRVLEDLREKLLSQKKMRENGCGDEEEKISEQCVLPVQLCLLYRGNLGQGASSWAGVQHLVWEVFKLNFNWMLI